MTIFVQLPPRAGWIGMILSSWRITAFWVLSCPTKPWPDILRAVTPMCANLHEQCLRRHSRQSRGGAFHRYSFTYGRQNRAHHFPRANPAEPRVGKGVVRTVRSGGGT